MASLPFAIVLMVVVWRALRAPYLCGALVLGLYGVVQVITRALFADPGLLWAPKLVLAAFILMCLTRIWARLGGQARFHLRTTQLLCLAYTAYFFISMGWSGHEDPRGTILGLAPAIVLFVVFAPKCVRTPRQLRDCLHLAIVLWAAACTTVLLHPQWWAEWGRLRIVAGPAEEYGTFNPLMLGELGALTFMASTLLWTNRPSRRLFWLLTAGVGLWVSLSATRGESLTAVAVVLVMFFVARGVRHPRGLVTSFVGIVLVVGIVLAAANRMLDTQFGQHWGTVVIVEGFEQREYLAVTLLETLWHEPSAWLFGLGGQYSLADPRLAMKPHNAFVQALCETGLVGLTLYVAIYIPPLAGLYGLWPKIRKNPEWRGLAITLTAFLLYYAVCGLKRGGSVDPLTFLSLVLIDRFVQVTRARLATGRPARR